MPREIKTTIAVDGEAAFKRAINEANTSIRNMGTQLTLATAQFKKDGDAMKLMETRSKALKGEIGQQQEIVKALEKAVTDSAKAFGENSDKTEKWEAELNRAKAKLISLQNELTLNNAGLDKSGKAFDESSEKAADYQATLQTIGKGVSFENVTAGIGKITGSVEGAIKKVFELAKAVRDAMVEAGNWADDLETDAKKYNMDVETLQRWRNAADFIDTDVETIINARDKLSKKMKSGWKGGDDGKLNMWEVLGIDLTDAETGKARDKMDVMWDVGETLLHVAEAQELGTTNLDAEALSMEVFGKSWRDMLPLFKAGRAEWEDTVAQQKVVSAEHVKSLTEMDDANERIENSWETLKYSFLAEIAPTMTEITDSISNLLDEFNSWMETEEGKKAMEDLSGAIHDLFSGISDIKFSDAINVAKDAINGIKDALVWLKQNSGGVENALKIVAGGFGLLKLGEGAASVLELVAGIKFLTGKGAAATAAKAAEDVGGSFGTALTSAIAKAAPWLIGIYEILKPGESKDNPIIDTDYKGDTYDMTKHHYVADKTGNRVMIEENVVDEDGYITIPYIEQRKEIEEDVDLEDYTPEQIADAIQDWWDANQNAKKGEEDWGEVSKAQDWMEEVLGDSFGEVWESIVHHLDETKNQDKLKDIPEEWYMGAMERAAKQSELNAQLQEILYNTGIAGPVNQKTLEYWRSGGEDSIKGSDLREFNRLPGQVGDKVQIGVQKGLSGFRIQVDGYTLARAMYPYISEMMGNAAQ